MDYAVGGVRVFLACVLLASGWSKRGPEWPQRLAAYGLVGRPTAIRAAPLIPWVEVAVAVSLLAAPTGLLAGGVIFLGFGVVQALARIQGYEGECGCSKAGRVSWLTALRALAWGSLALGLGVGAIIGPPSTAAVAFAVLETSALVAITVALRLLKPRGQLRGSRGGEALGSHVRLAQ